MYMQETPQNIFLRTREEYGHSIDEIEAATKIYKKYIFALEKKNFGVLPSPVYTLNFIKSYAAFLEIQNSSEIEEYIREYKNFANQDQQTEMIKKYVKTTPTHVLNIPKLCKRGIGALIIISSMVYLGMQVREIFKQPQLAIIEPINNLITNEGSIMIKGETEPEIEVFINESIVLGDEKGNFERKVDLHPGINLITITATSKHGKQTSLVRQILFEPAGEKSTSMLQ